MSIAQQRAAAAAILSGQYDDGLTTFYDRGLGSSPGHIQYNGITRVGVRFDASASGLTKKVMSVRVRFRKYGSPTGNVTVNVRKASDDTVAATIGTWSIQSFGMEGTEQEIAIRNRFNNSYQMVTSDLVTVEFPSNATNGLEISTNTTDGAVANYTGKSFNGTVYANTANPPAITIKGG